MKVEVDDVLGWIMDMIIFLWKRFLLHQQMTFMDSQMDGSHMPFLHKWQPGFEREKQVLPKKDTVSNPFVN